MATSASVTVTGKAGPGITVTAKTFTGVQRYVVDVGKGILTLFYSSDNDGPTQEFDINAATTMTVTISSGNQTVTIS